MISALQSGSIPEGVAPKILNIVASADDDIPLRKKRRQTSPTSSHPAKERRSKLVHERQETAEASQAPVVNTPQPSPLRHEAHENVDAGAATVSSLMTLPVPVVQFTYSRRKGPTSLRLKDVALPTPPRSPQEDDSSPERDCRPPSPYG